MVTRIDLHTHSTWGSSDSIVSPEELVQRAREVGLDSVCVTEHGNVRFPFGAELSARYGMLVIGAFEASTELGDLLVFGVDSFPRTIFRAADLAAFLRERGGVIVAAHPFRYDLSPKPWLRPRVLPTLEQACERRVFKLVDAAEVVNGWATPQDVAFSQAVSARLGLGGTGGSDAHAAYEVGLCYTEFADGIRSEAELLAALRDGAAYRAVDRRPDALKGPLHTAKMLAR